MSVTNRLSTGCQVVNRSFCYLIGSHRILHVRSIGGTFRRRVYGALEGTRDACLLGELFCRRPVLPCSAPPPRCAPRLGPPVVCPGLGVDKYTYSMVMVSSREYKLRIRLRGVQSGVTAGAGYTRRRRMPRRGSPVRATQTDPAHRDSTNSPSASGRFPRKSDS